MTEVLLLDYGDVLSEPFPDAAYADLEAALGAPVREGYWAHRAAYDQGLADADYWSRVLGRPLDAGVLDEVVRIDRAGWSHVDPAALGPIRRARASALRIALLSNMPHSQADAYEREPWAELFDDLFFSCRLGLVKPDPAIFERALAALGVPAGEVVFLDDKPGNVDAAAGLGIDARVCRGAAELAVAVDGLDAE